MAFWKRRDKLTVFVELLEQQADDDSGAIDGLRNLALSTEDGYAVYNLWREWSQAFSYWPGRKEALEPIRALASKLETVARDDSRFMYQQPEWAALLRLRGPVEAIVDCVCVSCRHQHVRMGTSGFLDIAGWVCAQCGNVHFSSVYEDRHAAVVCKCGAKLAPPMAGCPRCGGETRTTGTSSPYEYFATHEFTRDP